MSAELIEKHESGDKDSERDPEMEIGGDYPKDVVVGRAIR
jgi:hypothetical protein